jgi:hypothetical protein
MNPGSASVALSIASAGFGASSSIMKGQGAKVADPLVMRLSLDPTSGRGQFFV